MAIILALFKQSSRKIIPAIVFSIISAYAFTVMIALIHKGLEGNFSGRIVWGFFGTLVVYSIIEIIGKRLFLSISLEVTSKLREDISQILLQSSPSNLERLSTHRVQGILQGELDFIASAISDMAHVTIKTFQVVGVVGYFGYTNPKVIFIALVFIPVLFFLQYLPSLKAEEYIRRERVAMWAMHRRFEEIIFGARELFQNYAKRIFFLNNELKPSVQNFKAVSLRNRTIDYIFSHWNDILIFLSMGSLVFVLGGNNIISVALSRDIVLFVLVLKDPALAAVNLAGNIYRANIRMKNLNSMGFDLEKLHQGELASSDPSVKNRFENFSAIRLENISMQYPGNDQGFALGPISMELRRGDLVFIIGGNGSGKTTLIKLLAGLYEPTAGFIAVDDHPVTSECAQLYRDLFHVIFSDFYLFPQVKLENFGVTKGAEARRLLNLFELEGKTSINGEGVIANIDLSQGQRKRLALIVALLEDRKIYVLDEWAADQDPHFKKIFYTQILPDLKASGKTLIVISHDDRYYDMGDRQIVLEDGKIRSVHS